MLEEERAMTREVISASKTIRVPAIRVRQNEHDLFMADLTADLLLSHARVDKWTHASTKKDPSEQGYQREELRAHYSKVGNYLVKNRRAILPTSVLLSVREPVRFEPIETDD